MTRGVRHLAALCAAGAFTGMLAMSAVAEESFEVVGLAQDPIKAYDGATKAPLPNALSADAFKFPQTIEPTDLTGGAMLLELADGGTVWVDRMKVQRKRSVCDREQMAMGAVPAKDNSTLGSGREC